MTLHNELEIMKVKNRIVSYFASPSSNPDGKPRVFLSPITMGEEVARKVIQRELGPKDKLSYKKMLHVCFDVESRLIYLPNANELTKMEIAPLMDAAKARITEDYGSYKLTPIIEGSPFSSLRLRSISSFGYIEKSIREYFGSFEDIPVVEANLKRMSSTVSQLPKIYKNNKNYAGGYIGDKEIVFYDEMDIRGRPRKEKIKLLSIKPPFILIDISPEISPSITQKEWSVLSGYRDYLYSKDNVASDDIVSSFAPLYAAKRYMYLGWPFEEICSTFIGCVSNFGEFIKATGSLLTAATSLAKEGYENPARIPYYLTFKIDPKTFPLRLESVNKENQIPFFKIVDYDDKTGFILIETPVFIDSQLCLKVFKAKSRPFIARYNTTLGKIDVKVPSGVLKELELRTEQAKKIKNLIIQFVNSELGKNVSTLEFKTDERARATSLSDSRFSNIRNISDYYHATDHIKKMCQSRNLSFVDIKVVIGPLDRIFGPGIQGGFMGEKEFKKSKLKIPHQIDKGLYVTPPIMAVNSNSMPSYAEQTETLIHEYSHNLFSMVNPEHEHLYNKKPNLRKTDHHKYWFLYLNDPDERLAHKEEIRYELLSGKSVDEIVRDKVGGAITVDSYLKNYPIALQFKILVDEVAKELE